MANEVLHKTGTPIVWADSTDYSGPDFTQTHQLDLTSLGSGAARQGVKADLGATRARQYAVMVAFEFTGAPTAGTTVNIYWSSSPSATAGTANTGGASGTDAAYKYGEEDEWVKQLDFLGSLVATNDASTTVQKQVVAIFTPPQRYGMPVVHNDTDDTGLNDAVEMYVALIPIIDEVQ